MDRLQSVGDLIKSPHPNKFQKDKKKIVTSRVVIKVIYIYAYVYVIP